MQKCFCDRCGKELDPVELYKIEENRSGVLKEAVPGSYFGEVHQWQPCMNGEEYFSPRVDLCVECRKDFDSLVTDFMSNK